jgi:hypothetical protein
MQQRLPGAVTPATGSRFGPPRRILAASHSFAISPPVSREV